MRWRADTVGSLLRPQAVHDARARFHSGAIDAATLRRIEDDAIRAVVRSQEEVGLRVITDGEFRRENWYADFMRRIDGVVIAEGEGRAFAAQSAQPKYVPKQVRTVGKLSAPGAIMVDEYRFLAALTDRVAKITIPSPTRLHFHGGRSAVSQSAYPDIEVFFADVAQVYQREIAALEAAGCRYIQIDDPLLSYFLSPVLRREVIEDGDDPDRRLARYVQLVNDCIRLRGADTTIGIHICRGNARSSWIAQGAYDGIAEVCFGGLAADRFLLEFDDERSGSFEPLRFLPPGKQVVLGLVTTKHGRLENKADLKRRIEAAARFVDADRLAISPQCGFASVVEGNLITPEQQWAKLRLVVETARELWGSA
ncbi:MAG: 5-methyltetrahydropteroyltriglutamate--homocysteine S-methyltransferase [Hyphomicrobiales bacterium]|nr:5-methyltetrahydropteroyltriglutamate--homocysteine S-methyltransferase [Hyphomicrobiales bacterium]